MYKIMITGISIFLLSACSSSGGSEKYNGLAKNENMVCEHTAQTGSHMKKKKCMSKELSEAVRQKNQEALRRLDKKGQTFTNNKGG